MSEELVRQPIVWIDSDEKLEDCAKLWHEKKLIALDTEFMRSRTYYPIAGLIQLNDGDSNYLIDPLKINDYFPLIDVFDQEHTYFALHSCSEDLEVFTQEIGCVPKNIFDTQIACAMTGSAFSLGYGNAAKEILGIELPKGETRSDWLQRPLSNSQIFYAALDVDYLYELATILIKKLNDNNRFEWVIEDGNEILRNYKRLQDPEQSYTRVKSAWKLKPRQLAVLMSLSKWREHAAQARDVPRNNIVKESALLDLSFRCPTHIRQLREITGISERMIKKSGERIIELIEEVLALPDSELPEALPKPISKSEQLLLRALKDKSQELANSLNIAPEILLKKKDFESIIRNVGVADQELRTFALSGWRHELLEDSIKDVVDQYESAC